MDGFEAVMNQVIYPASMLLAAGGLITLIGIITAGLMRDIYRDNKDRRTYRHGTKKG